MTVRANNMKISQTIRESSRHKSHLPLLQQVLPVFFVVFCLLLSIPRVANANWVSDAANAASDAVSDAASAAGDALNEGAMDLGEGLRDLGSAVTPDVVEDALDDAGAWVGQYGQYVDPNNIVDGAEAAADFFTNGSSSGTPTVPKLFPPTQREMSASFNGKVSGPNLYLRNDGVILTEINAGVEGGPLWVLRQLELTTPHDHVTGQFPNPSGLPVIFNPIERKVSITTVENVLNACRSSSSGKVNFRIPVTIKATLDPNPAVFTDGLMDDQRVEQMKGRVEERASELIFALNCSSTAVVKKVYNETCPAGFVLESTNEPITQHELSEIASASSIQRSRCVRPN